MSDDRASLDAIMPKVRKLIDHADHPGTGAAEAAMFRLKAEELIKEYRLKEADLLAQDPSSITPYIATYDLIRLGSDFTEWMGTLFFQAVRHVDGLAVTRWERNDNGVYYLRGKVSAFDVDHRYLALLWSSMRLAFIAHLEPEFNPNETEAENIYRLRRSGMARKDVAQKIYGKWTHANSAKVGKVYKEECTRRGETPALDGKGIDLKTFRDVYAREFVYRVWDRLEAARTGALAGGGPVELAGRKDRVEEKFYEEFPHLRPKPAGECEEQPSEPVKKARKRMAVTETKAYKEKIRRQYLSPAALAGAEQGKKAGDSVEISRVADRTERLGYE